MKDTELSVSGQNREKVRKILQVTSRRQDCGVGEGDGRGVLHRLLPQATTASGSRVGDCVCECVR